MFRVTASYSWIFVTHPRASVYVCVPVVKLEKILTCFGFQLFQKYKNTSSLHPYTNPKNNNCLFQKTAPLLLYFHMKNPQNIKSFSLGLTCLIPNRSAPPPDIKTKVNPLSLTKLLKWWSDPVRGPCIVQRQRIGAGAMVQRAAYQTLCTHAWRG